MVIIDIDELDFINSPEATNQVITKIETALNGLF
jgi:deoxyadenosine/deoxycytidine kinase